MTASAQTETWRREVGAVRVRWSQLVWPNYLVGNLRVDHADSHKGSRDLSELRVLRGPAALS